MYIGCVADLLERVVMSETEIEIVDIHGARLHRYAGDCDIEERILECEVVDFEVLANKITIWTWGDPESRPIL